MPDLSSSNAKLILSYAHEAIKEHLYTGDAMKVARPASELMVKQGCFVTLRKQGKLRGCVGTFDATEPLLKNVLRMAVSAAVQDHRFEPVKKDELGDLAIDISILGECEKVSSPEEIEIGKHGVLIKLGSKTGTYLPDVAVEQKWSAMEFVMDCAREKAGLRPEQIAQAEIYRYEVQKISDDPS